MRVVCPSKEQNEIDKKYAVWISDTTFFKQKKERSNSMVELDHIALIVSTEQSLKFYEKLGFKAVRRIERAYDTVVFMQCGQTILEIFIDPRHPERIADPEANGLRHIAFLVENLEEVMKIVECEDIRTDWFGDKFTFTKDPDGQPIELKEKRLAFKSASYTSNDKWAQEYKEQFGTEPSFM